MGYRRVDCNNSLMLGLSAAKQTSLEVLDCLEASKAIDTHSHNSIGTSSQFTVLSFTLAKIRNKSSSLHYS